MKTFLVVFAPNYPRIAFVQRSLERFPTWVRILENAYIIKGEGHTVVTVRDFLRSLDQNILFSVFDITRQGWASSNFRADIADWMVSNI